MWGAVKGCGAGRAFSDVPQATVEIGRNMIVDSHPAAPQSADVNDVGAKQQPEHPSLDAVLAGQRVGAWVVLDDDMTHVLAAADTPEEAMFRAEEALKQTAFEQVPGERPVMLQVPDPSTVCFY